MIAIGLAMAFLCWLVGRTWSNADPIGYHLDQGWSIVVGLGYTVGLVVGTAGIVRWLWVHA